MAIRQILVLGNVRSPHTQRWSQGYAERGYEVHVLSIRHHEISDVVVHSVSVGPRNSSSWLWSLLSYIRMLLRVPSLVRQLRPDVVNAHFSLTHGAVAALWRIRPLVVSTWGRDVIGPNGPLPIWKRLLNSWVFRRADHVTVTSRFMEEPVRRLAGSKPPISRIPFGVDTSVFKPAIAPDTTRGGFNIGFVKHLKKKYGPMVLIEAMEGVRARIPDARLVMAGEGELLPLLRKACTDLGIEDCVEFRGRVEHREVPALIRELDVLVNPSVEESETFGVVLLEAMATEVPVLVTSVGGMGEVVGDDGEVGLVIPPNDAFALGDALVALAHDHATRVDMGRKGRQRVRDSFEWDRSLDAMLATLEESASTSSDVQPSTS